MVEAEVGHKYLPRRAFPRAGMAFGFFFFEEAPVPTGTVPGGTSTRPIAEETMILLPPATPLPFSNTYPLWSRTTTL